MKFLDLHTGYSFDALWKEDQQKGYIFWFPNEQSVGITYTMPIAIITDDSTPLKLSIEDNDVFSFISHSDDVEIVDGYEFNGYPIFSNTVTTECEQVMNKYIHLVNVSCCSQNAVECICKIYVNDNAFIRVGADFYSEAENVFINAANMGIEIPTTVQKAIYDTNVHEDATDNIIANRKFKELLSNYWDIIANKGSYKSLINALEWFEWNNELKIKEIWKHHHTDKIMFSDEDMLGDLEDRIENIITNFTKTTYVSLYCALQNELDTYDLEGNPELQQVIFKWSRNDIQLKIALLAKFFDIYFTPIHLSLLHATTEDIVFTNTLKVINNCSVSRRDAAGSIETITCNINKGDLYKMGNVNVIVTENTPLGVIPLDADKRPSDYKYKWFGVDIFPNYINKQEFPNLIIYDESYYAGPGIVIPVDMRINNVSNNTQVGRIVIDCNCNDEQTIFDSIYKPGVYELNDSCMFTAVDGVIDIKFNMLLLSAGKYDIKFNIILNSGQMLTHYMDFSVEDTTNLVINTYKIKSKDDSKGLVRNDYYDNNCSKYLLKMQKNDDKYYTQYLPYMSPDNELYDNYNGIKLNRTIIFDAQNKNKRPGFRPMSDAEIFFVRSVMSLNYLEFAKYNGNKITYLIFVSKYFFADTPKALYDNVFGYKFNIIRNDLGFYPQFHYLEKMDGDDIDNYTVSPYEAVCCAAEINNNGVDDEFKYGHLIDTSEWTFYNHNTGEYISHPGTSRQPFVVKSTNDVMNPGYYDISFNYSLTNGITQECKLESAFRIKN